jgi:hypothetical protein
MTPSSRFPLAGFILCALAAFPALAAKHQKFGAIDPEWDDRGIDTTQPQWYRKHPFWTHIQKPFRKQCDSIVARLKDSVPAKPDTVLRHLSGKVEAHPDSVRGKGLVFVGRGLILRPQLLRSSPYNGTPVGVIRPEDGPWKVISIYRPEGVQYPPPIQTAGKMVLRGGDEMQDTVDLVTLPENVLNRSFPGFKALVATADKTPLGWLPVDSIALFPDPKDAEVSAPFYQDGIAAYVHGAWKEQDQSGGGEGEPDTALMNLGNLHIQDMIHLWSITLSYKAPDLKKIPKAFQPCFHLQKDPEDPGFDFPYLSTPCVERSPVLSLGYFYKEAGWERFRRIRRVSVSGSAKDQWFGFSLHDSPGLDVGAIVTSAPGGIDSGYLKQEKRYVP